MATEKTEKTETAKKVEETKKEEKTKKVENNKTEDKSKNLKTADKKDNKAKEDKKEVSAKKSDEKQSSANKILGIKENSKSKKAKDDKTQADKAAAKGAKSIKKLKSKKKKSKIKAFFLNPVFRAIGRFFKFIGKSIAKLFKTIAKSWKKSRKNFKATYTDRQIKTMKKRTFIVIFGCVIVAFAIIGCFKLFGALEINGGQAARVDDKYISEAEVTKYIKEQTLFRNYAKNTKQWAQYISMYGMTAESFRTSAIDDKFVHEELVRRASDQLGISVSDEEVDSHVASLKSKYTTDNNYKKALENSGFTEESYRESVRMMMLQKALIAQVVTTDMPSDDDVKEYLSSYSSGYKDARKASQILFSDKDSQKAQEVLDKINSGQITWEAAVATYSIDESSKNNAGVIGWDKIDSFSSAVNEAISSLSVGQVSELVTDKQGIHIIKCIDKWDTPDKVESLDGVPKDIIEECRIKKNESNQVEKLKEWLSNWKDENGIIVETYPMPTTVPYYVDPNEATSAAAANSAASSSSPITTDSNGTPITTDSNGTPISTQ